MCVYDSCCVALATHVQPWREAVLLIYIFHQPRTPEHLFHVFFIGFDFKCSFQGVLRWGGWKERPRRPEPEVHLSVPRAVYFTPTSLSHLFSFCSLHPLVLFPFHCERSLPQPEIDLAWQWQSTMLNNWSSPLPKPDCLKCHTSLQHHRYSDLLKSKISSILNGCMNFEKSSSGECGAAVNKKWHFIMNSSERL